MFSRPSTRAGEQAALLCLKALVRPHFTPWWSNQSTTPLKPLSLARSVKINPATYATRLIWLAHPGRQPGEEMLRKLSLAGCLAKPVKRVALRECLASILADEAA
jgi:hypothetical protein